MRRSILKLIPAITLLSAAVCISAAAQQPGPPGGGRQGGRGGGFGGGMRGGRQVSVANVPVEALEKPLSLSADQKTRITAIQTKAREEMRGMFPQGGPGGGGFRRGGGQPGGPPAGGPPAGAPPPGGRPGGDFQAIMQKITDLNTKTQHEIEGVLNASQKAKLPGLIREFQAARGAGIPLEVIG